MLTTQIYFGRGYNLDTLSEQVSAELDNLNIWFSVNKLSLNVNKTNFILFSGKKEVNHVSIKINNENIERVYSTKFLGVIIDNKLSWKDHINKVKAKLSKCISILYKCNSLIEISTLRTLYCSLFLPHINYCCEVRGMATDSTLRSINMLQKRAIRAICKEQKYAHTSNLFYNLKLLKFNDMVKLKTSLIMFKAMKAQLPGNLQNKFELTNSECYTLRSYNKFKVKFARTTTLKHKCISVYGVKLYNSLPKNLTSIPNISSFKT